jgi:hypothetical protein
MSRRKKPKTYTEEYWQQIQSGEVVACKRLIQQYEKLIEELQNPRDPWVFDLDKDLNPSNLLKGSVKHSKGKWIGKPVKLELFQKARSKRSMGCPQGHRPTPLPGRLG